MYACTIFIMLFRCSGIYGCPLYVVIGILLAVCGFQLHCVHGQPTIQEFYWEESCNKNKDDEIRQALDFILLEVQRQKHENHQLRSELEEIKQKSTEHRLLLLQLSDNVSLLVHKLLNSSNYCNCRSSGPDVKPDHGAGVKKDTGSKVLKNVNSELPQADSENNVIINRKKKKKGFKMTAVQTPTSTLSVIPTFSTTPGVDPLLEIYNGFVPRDCQDLLDYGYNRNGTYQIRPNNSRDHFQVLCEFIEKKAWTLIQKRVGGFVDFYRNWEDYKDGFGNLAGEFWLGNEKIHLITNQASYKLGIDMWDWRNINDPQDVSRYYFSQSAFFHVGNESSFYELQVPEDYYDYSGFGGSGLRVHAGSFVTWDKMPPDMRVNCAVQFHCGWWFSTCVRNANFNGRYYKDGYKDLQTRTRAPDDIYWPNIEQSLRKVILKLQRNE